MFHFIACCSKFLLLVAAISVLSYSFGVSALSSMPSDAFNGDLLMGELPYSIDSSGIITLKLKKNSKLAQVELVIPEEHAISFFAIQPTGCSAFKIKEGISVGFSYAGGCSKIFRWSTELFHMGEDGYAKPVNCEVAISIENGRTKQGVLMDKSSNKKQYDVCPTNFKKNDQSNQAGYLVYLTLSGNLDCDVSVRFPFGYKILEPPVGKAAETPSQALTGWHKLAIGFSGSIIAVSLVLVLIFVCWKYVFRPKPVLPTASTANPSAPVAVTCLPEVKVIRPTATTQPPPVSNDLKLGQERVPIPLPPASNDLKQRQKPAPIPPPPVPAVEKDLPVLPSEKLLAIDDGDEVRLAPNTIEITSLEKKRRKNRRMLKAVDDDEKSAALRGRSLALRNKKQGGKAKEYMNIRP